MTAHRILRSTMAIVAARQVAPPTRSAHIKTAIEINPDSRIQARQDEEFDILELDEFHTLTERRFGAVAPQPFKKPRK